MLHKFVNEMMEASNVPDGLGYQDVRYLISSLLNDGTDTELAGADYSSTNNIGKFTSAGNMVLTSMRVVLTDTDVPQDTTNVYDLIDAEGMVIANTPLSNGFQIGVKRVDGTTIVDIAETLPIKSLYQWLSLAHTYFLNNATEDATTGNNMTSAVLWINFAELFGTGLLLRDSDYIYIKARDNVTGLNLNAQVFGYAVE